MPDDIIDDPQTPDTEPSTPSQSPPAAPATTPEDTRAGMLAAMSEAIDAETPPAAKPAEALTQPDDDAAAAGGETDGKPPLERDENGRFKPRADAAGAAAQAPAKPDAAAAAKTNGKAEPAAADPNAAKAPDPLNDPIPPEIKGKTRERMETLVKTAKELTTARDQAVSERDEILGMIQQTRATPEQYGEMLDYLSAVNSGDPTRIRQALTRVQGELAALSRILGEPVAGVDLLAEHADLRAEVEAGDLSVARAQEIAAARAQRAVQTNAAQHGARAQEAQTAVDRGRAALNNLEAELMRADTNYAAKRAVLIEVLQPIMANLPPAQWAAAYKSAYERLPATVVAPPPTPTPTPAQNQPLRARQPAGQGQRAPATMLEALNQAIDGR